MEIYCMKEYMKSSGIKKIIVKCLNWREEIEIDSAVFDDVYMEAATRAIEKRMKLPNFNIAVVMECYDKKDVRKKDKHFVYNTYFVLVNVGQHHKAELLRMNFLKEHGVDLQKESMKGEDENGTNPTDTNKSK